MRKLSACTNTLCSIFSTLLNVSVMCWMIKQSLVVRLHKSNLLCWHQYLNFCSHQQLILANRSLTEVVYFAAFTSTVLCACSVLVRNQIIFYLCFVLGFFKTGGRCLLSLLWTFVAVFQAGHCTRKYDNKYRDPCISVVLKTVLHMKSLLYLQSVFCSFNSCCLPF